MHPILSPGMLPRGKSGSSSDGEYFGPIRRHEADSDTVGLWQFDGDLTDSSGNGYTLTLSSGYENYADMWPGTRGILLTGAQRLTGPGNGSKLYIAGDMTIEYLVLQHRYVSSSRVTVSYDWAYGTPSQYNTQYAFGQSPTYGGLSYRHRTGSGVTVSTEADHFPNLLVSHLAVSRRSNYAYIYHNGALVGSADVSPGPTGGESCIFVIGYYLDYYAPACILGSVKVCDVGYTEDQVKGEYNYTLGEAFGYRI